MKKILLWLAISHANHPEEDRSPYASPTIFCFDLGRRYSAHERQSVWIHPWYDSYYFLPQPMCQLTDALNAQKALSLLIEESFNARQRIAAHQLTVVIQKAEQKSAKAQGVRHGR